MKEILDFVGYNDPCKFVTVEDGCNLCPHWRKESKKFPERIPSCFGGGPEEKAERDRLKKEAKELAEKKAKKILIKKKEEGNEQK